MPVSDQTPETNEKVKPVFTNRFLTWDTGRWDVVE